MADVQFGRYCIHFFNTRECPNGTKCSYTHKTNHEVEQFHYVVGNEFFLGKLRNQRVCRYFRRGHCIHQQNCHYLHDNSEPAAGRGSIDRVSRNTRAGTNANPPSTSQTADMVNKNTVNNRKELPNKQLKISSEEILTCKKIEETSKSEDAKEEGACASPVSSFRDSWVNAPEFIPKSSLQPRSYAAVLGSESANDGAACYTDLVANRKLCPYANKDGVCRNILHCTYLHGEKCDMCERLILHPFNEEQRKKHRQECLMEHEKNMELSFAIARSKEKSCGVCFEVIMEKASGEQRFGILPNCNHCFCLTCIRRWRQARQFENKITRACPECRVTSDFVCPSMYWVDTKEDKDKLIDDYKSALARKDCKYFKKGQGKCPFGNKCFYLHALPDGRKLDVGPPPRQRRPRNQENNIDVLQVNIIIKSRNRYHTNILKNGVK
ncbi:unnamed protein product [Acanthoscelides obtectus]|uniref:RING-type E3 ubiquitin transferase n=1 Tax=Acanthoscelides obtectus TaxID=200917 RepID=A0A9P0JR94_ACAOB|nr:unnamed protein product [Acanthoscelides obtectus]CAK1628886.1 Probable E3 ubiquitin-protein ligase makorin-1 [Acanthoscelides obtectus]